MQSREILDGVRISAHASLLAAAIICVAPTLLAAQHVAATDSGTRVRVSIVAASPRWPFGSDTEQLEGTLRSISTDSLALSLSPLMSPIAIPRSSIRRVEISLGPSPHGHALLGGAIGATIFGLRMYVVDQDPQTRHFTAHWQAALVGGILGLAGGAWLGGHVPNERWQTVSLPN